MSEEFIANFPVYSIAPESQPGSLQLIYNKNDPSSAMMMIYTDRDLADRAIAASPPEHPQAIVIFEHPGVLLSAMVQQKEKGVTHVGIDTGPGVSPGDRYDRKRTVPIESLLNRFEWRIDRE